MTTKAEEVLCNKAPVEAGFSPCQQEEADIRMFLCLQDESQQGHSKAYIYTVDTDVVVLAIYHFMDLNLDELWIGFCSGKSFKEIPIHVIAQGLDHHCRQGLLFFHAYTGCDVTSAMYNIGKKQLGTRGKTYLRLQMPLLQLLRTQLSLILSPHRWKCLKRSQLRCT